LITNIVEHLLNDVFVFLIQNIMNTITMRLFQFNTLLAALLILFAFSFSACSKKVNFLTSDVVPAARGYVTVKSDNNNNYVIQVFLSSLAEVQRLEPAKETYVVWMETDKHVTKNLGQIKSSSSLLSKKLKATFESVSALKPVKVFITAENDASLQYPGTQVVLSTDRF
jgi:hypothetical protein